MGGPASSLPQAHALSAEESERRLFGHATHADRRHRSRPHRDGGCHPSQATRLPGGAHEDGPALPALRHPISLVGANQRITNFCRTCQPGGPDARNVAPAGAGHARPRQNTISKEGNRMNKNITGEFRRSDYSLVGKDAALAVEKGLANAKWYASPVPREKMRELLERRDGPAIRDTLLWFFLLFVFGIWRLCSLGHLVGRHPVCRVWRALCLGVRFALARKQPRDGLQDRLAEQHPLRNRFVHGAAGSDSLALEPQPAPQRHDHRGPGCGDCGAAPGESGARCC